jgi:hypothetical protein
MAPSFMHRQSDLELFIHGVLLSCCVSVLRRLFVYRPALDRVIVVHAEGAAKLFVMYARSSVFLAVPSDRSAVSSLCPCGA